MREHPLPRRVRHLLSVALAVVTLAACGAYPRDVEGSLDRIVERGTVRVGVANAEPFVLGADPGAEADPRGLEVRLVEAFAEHLGVEVVWFPGSEAEAVAALERGELDIVAAGLDSITPYAARVGLTRSYLTTDLTVGVPPGTPLPFSIENAEVAAVDGSEAMGLLRMQNARPQSVAEREDLADRVAVVEDHYLDDLGLQATDNVLLTTRHVLAVRSGENGLLVALERFLHDLGPGTIRTWLDEEVRG